MCEFDTMSESEEVIEVLHKSVEVAMADIFMNLESPEAKTALLQKLSDMRGLLEGSFRSRQFMALVRRFMHDQGHIRSGLTQLISIVRPNELEYRVNFIKSVLGML